MKQKVLDTIKAKKIAKITPAPAKKDAKAKKAAPAPAPKKK